MGQQAEQREPEKAAYEIGYYECAEEGLLDAVQRLLGVGALEDVLNVIVEACDTLAAVEETSRRDADRWKAAGEAIRDLTEDEAIKDAP